jgi:hypothetical protein
MENFIEEHGGTIIAMIVGCMLLTVVFVQVFLLKDIMPGYENNNYENNDDIIKNINDHPVFIDSEDVVYVTKYDTDFDISQYIKAYDSDMTDLSDRINIRGDIDINTSGVYFIQCSVESDMGARATKNIHVIVESA